MGGKNNKLVKKQKGNEPVNWGVDTKVTMKLPGQKRETNMIEKTKKGIPWGYIDRV